MEGGSVTFRVTGMLSGLATPLTVTLTDERYIPTGRLVGFTRTLKLPGSVPLLGLTVSQRSVDGEIAVVYPGFPELAFTETLCAAGSAVALD